MDNTRISWQEYAIRLAQVASLRSIDPFRKVGCAILDHENRVISLGYNGVAKGVDIPEIILNDRDRRRPFMIHAEMNALSLIQRGNGKLLACTCMPCPCCSNIIAAHGIETVVYLDDYDTDMQGLEILNFHGIKVSKISIAELKNLG
jgi:dCMP deaminase